MENAVQKNNVLRENHDPMGRAIADYYKNGVAGRLRVFSSMFDEDEIPVAHLFREEDEMGELELKALEPTLSRNIIKLQITDNHILSKVQSKSKSF